MNEGKKRRLVLTSCAAAPVPTEGVEAPAVVALSESCGVSLRSRPAQMEKVQSAEQLGLLLQREAERALETHAQWARSPHAAWIQTLLGDLSDGSRDSLLARQRRLYTMVADDFSSKWSLGADFAGKVIKLWLSAEGRTLDDVLEKCDEFGHSALPSGVVLSGRWVLQVASQQPTDVSIGSLMPWVQSLCSQPGSADAANADSATASLYRVAKANHFHTDPQTEVVLTELPDELSRKVTSGEGCV